MDTTGKKPAGFTQQVLREELMTDLDGVRLES
jgi:hypothetical protein